MPLADMADCILQCQIPISVIRRRSAPVVMGRVGETTEETICPRPQTEVTAIVRSRDQPRALASMMKGR